MKVRNRESQAGKSFMKTEMYIEAEGEVHRIAQVLTYVVFPKCDKILQRAGDCRITNNPQGRKCRECFAGRPDIEFPITTKNLGSPVPPPKGSNPPKVGSNPTRVGVVSVGPTRRKGH